MLNIYCQKLLFKEYILNKVNIHYHHYSTIIFSYIFVIDLHNSLTH